MPLKGRTQSRSQDGLNVFALFKLIGTAEQTNELRKKYLAGNFGYGHAKQELLALLIEHFRKERETFQHLMAHEDELNSILEEGEARARIVARTVLDRVRRKVY